MFKCTGVAGLYSGKQPNLRERLAKGLHAQATVRARPERHGEILFQTDCILGSGGGAGFISLASPSSESPA